jgi:hypothetical protein
MRNLHRQRGSSLAGTMVFLMLAMMLLAAVFRQTASCLRAEKAFALRQDRALGCTRAMACALTLLSAGQPPAEDYDCRLQLEDDPLKAYVLHYHLSGTLQYAVTVRPATAEDEFLPLAPTTFAPPPPVPPSGPPGLPAPPVSHPPVASPTR